MVLTFGNVDHPPFLDRLIPDHETTAWDHLGPLKVLGGVKHTMVGSLWGTDWFFRTPGTGLTHYGVGGSTDGPSWDGVILRWNDPTGAAHTVDYDGHSGKVSANRSGWANGTILPGSVEGPGIEFFNKYGYQINTLLFSVERSDGGNAYGQPVSPKQFESICRIFAYWADQSKIPWHVYPLNPDTGLSFEYWHLHFATKGCPHLPVQSVQQAMLARTIEILRSAQEQGGPSMEYPEGFDEALCRDVFGYKYAPQYQFNPNGSVSKVWLSERYICPLEYHFKDTTTGREIFVFSNGKTIGRYVSDEAFRTLDLA